MHSESFKKLPDSVA